MSNAGRAERARDVGKQPLGTKRFAQKADDVQRQKTGDDFRPCVSAADDHRKIAILRIRPKRGEQRMAGLVLIAQMIIEEDQRDISLDLKILARARGTGRADARMASGEKDRGYVIRDVRIVFNEQNFRHGTDLSDRGGWSYNFIYRNSGRGPRVAAPGRILRETG